MTTALTEIVEQELFLVSELREKELEAIIVECEPWVSHSRPEPVYWSAEQLLERLDMVKKGGNHNLVTRAYGIREKMIELLSK